MVDLEERESILPRSSAVVTSPSPITTESSSGIAVSVSLGRSDGKCPPAVKWHSIPESLKSLARRAKSSRAYWKMIEKPMSGG